MKKRLGGWLVVAACALISFAFASHSTTAWWTDSGPNHKHLADPEPSTVLPNWWTDSGPNH